MYIYKITNEINNKSYIGQTTGSIDLRFKRHIQRLNSGSKYALYEAFRKYGLKNFKVTILEEVNDLKLLTDREIHYINKYNSLSPNGYNMCIGPGGSSTKAIKGKHLKTGNVIKFKSISEATKSGFGKVQLIAVLNGRKKTYKNHIWTYINKNFPKVERKKSKGSISVVRIDPKTDKQKIFPSMLSAEKEGFDRGLISLCCQGIQPMHKNYIWKYKEMV